MNWNEDLSDRRMKSPPRELIINGFYFPAYVLIYI